MTNYFEYKGYIGTIEVNVDENIMYGKIHGITDLVTFESESVPGIKEEFQKAVDDYLRMCELLGKAPSKRVRGGIIVGNDRTSSCTDHQSR